MHACVPHNHACTCMHRAHPHPAKPPPMLALQDVDAFMPRGHPLVGRLTQQASDLVAALTPAEVGLVSTCAPVFLVLGLQAFRVSYTKIRFAKKWHGGFPCRFVWGPGLWSGAHAHAVRAVYVCARYHVGACEQRICRPICQCECFPPYTHRDTHTHTHTCARTQVKARRGPGTPSMLHRLAKDFTAELGVYAATRRTTPRLELWAKRAPLPPVR